MRARLVVLSVLGVVVLAACALEEPAVDDAAFWSLLVFVGEPVDSYASVGDMSAAADLVVVGTIADVTAGREWGDVREAENRAASILFQVEVGEVVLGTLPTDSRLVTWEYGHPAFGLSELQGHLTAEGFHDARSGEVRPFPTGRVMLFLRSRDDFGTEIATAPEATFVGGTAYRLVSVGGLVVDSTDGAVLPIMGMEAQSPDGRTLITEVESMTLDQIVGTLKPEA